MAETSQEPVKKTRKILILAGMVTTFSSLAILIIFLGRTGVITVDMALLMLVALLGIYVGFGILITAHLVIYRLK
jgi:hypothetical protein